MLQDTELVIPEADSHCPPGISQPRPRGEEDWGREDLSSQRVPSAGSLGGLEQESEGNNNTTSSAFCSSAWVVFKSNLQGTRNTVFTDRHHPKGDRQGQGL